MRAALALAAVLMLASCGTTDQLTGGSNEQPPAPAPRANAGAPGARPGLQTPPPVDMTGRWLLASTAGGTCAMTFGSTPGSPEGSIAPEGGCPGNFFTSRRWAFDQGALLIRNHTGEQLAHLAIAGPGRFEGQAVTGETVSLTR